VKRLGKEEKRAGFGDAMSNGSHGNPALCVNFEVREGRSEYSLKRKYMCCHESKMQELFCFIYIPVSIISK